MGVNLHVRQIPNKGDKTGFGACSFGEYFQVGPTGQQMEQNRSTVCSLLLKKKKQTPHYQLVSLSMVLKLVHSVTPLSLSL